MRQSHAKANFAASHAAWTRADRSPAYEPRGPDAGAFLETEDSASSKAWPGVPPELRRTVKRETLRVN